MLKALTKNFSDIIKKVRGQGRLTEENIEQALKDIRLAMLEADVALPVVSDFLHSIKEDALGVQIDRNVNPGRAFTDIVYRQLTHLMGDAHAGLRLKKSPAVVLACGLQGVGKTTSLAKIAKRLKEREKKRVLLASTDIRRPAALAQLKILSADIGVNYAESDNMSDAVSRGKELMNIAHRQLTDVVLMDTAGRTTLDDDMMDEIRRLAESLKPAETLFFVDSMQGQDAVNTARRFHDTLPLTGIVLTKFDGDARGGAALSARAVIGAPVKFVGVGEKPDDLQDFHPARFASRILGMGDLASLAEQAAEKTDQSVIRRLGKKLKKPDHFDLNDQLAQMQQMKKMGGVDAMVDKMPGMIADKLRGVEADGDKMKHMEAIIYSMTPGERAAPEIIKASRKRRIAAGSGATVNLVNQLLTQHEQTRKIMKRFAKNPAGMMRMMQNLLG